MTATPISILEDIPVRNGSTVSSLIVMPSAAGRWPVVFMKGYTTDPDPGFVDHGYVWVSQGSRAGTTRFFEDGEDGYDSVEWIAAQPWCDGNVAMYGRSYHGMTQWLTARLAPPHLQAIIPQHVNHQPWVVGYRNYGALNLAMTAPTRAVASKEAGDRYGWERLFMHLPLIELAEEVGGEPNSLWTEYLEHSTYDDYWQSITLQEDDFRNIRIPVFHHAGWYDYYPDAAFRSFSLLRAYHPQSDIRINIGAVNHAGESVGERPGLEKGAVDQLGEAIRWLDTVIKGKNPRELEKPPIRLFVMGKNIWRDESEWPLTRMTPTSYYLQRPEIEGAGILTTEDPRDDPPSTYAYDPRDPVRSIGGNHSADFRAWHLDAVPGANLRAGSYDQTQNDGRHDVLVFASAPLQEPLEITGPVEFVLHAATDCPDTDWVVRLIDVSPEGIPYNITEGVLRARFRESIYSEPDLLEPGSAYEYRIVLLPTSNVFLKGHCIRVDISSSNWPLLDRNLNTGSRQEFDSTMRTANQTIYHDSDRPSHIVLPVIPGHDG